MHFTATEWRLLLIFVLLLLIFVLAMTIALGKVEEKTSHGLSEVIDLFSYMAAGAAGWAFGHQDKSK